MPVGRGFGATLGVGFESTWGTAVARTNWLRVKSCGLMRQRTKQAVEDLGSFGQASTAYRQFFVESDFAGGSLSWNLSYNDTSVAMMRHLLGGNATTGAGPFTHTVTAASPQPAGLTIEQINGTHGFNSAEVFEGCKLAGGRLSWEAGSLLTADVDVIAETSQGLVAAGTPTYTSGGEYVRHHHQAQATIGGTGIPLRSARITIDRGLERLHELGSLFTSEPVEQRFMATIDVVAAWQQATFDSNYLADTQGSLVFTFTGASSPNALTITGHNCLVMDVSREVTRAGWVEERIQFRAFADATNQGLTMAFVNSNALHTAN